MPVFLSLSGTEMAIEFYRKHGKEGLPGRTHTLIIARNVLNEKEVKYFLSNRFVKQRPAGLWGNL
jgi:hypothetical protein